MKYIFLVHSYTTYFVSKKIIEKNKLDEKDVIFLKARNFEIYDPYIDFKHPGLEYKFTIKNIINNWRLISRYDQWIREITNNSKYILYYPHTALRDLDYLLSHKNCQGYCLVEEGMAAYSNNLRPEKYRKNNFSIVHLKYLIMYKGRISYSRSFYNDDYMFAYGLSEHAFLGFSRKIVLERNFNTYHYNHFELKKSDLLFLLSSMADTGEIDEDIYIASVMVSLEKYFIQNNYKHGESQHTLYIKPHPQTDLNSDYFKKLIDQIRDVYSSAMNIKIWEFGPVEIQLDQKEFVLLAIDSSLILYAAMNDIKVFCCQDIFMPFVKHTIDWRIEDVIPEAISKKIHFIR